MELVAPAGNIEKLTYAWEYGAEAAYIGLKKFSLRVKADNFHEREHEEIARLKGEYAGRGTPKRLFCALNISFHNDDLRNFIGEIDYFKSYPIDAFIIQDIGLVRLLAREFPSVPMHLSTQANCINYEAVKMYRDLGFRRIVLGREASLADIAEIKSAVPEMEIECFAHGAMCIAYSGRCLMSAYLTGRSANSGFCSHSCRWEYRVLEERARPGEYFPIIEEDGFTALFSSKDLCMIDHLDAMKKAGIDSLKIEGRMKSLYYTALVTRAYRKKIDAVEGRITEEEAAPFVAELYNAAHREFGTGFYFSKDDANKTTVGETSSPYTLAGTIGKKIAIENGPSAPGGAYSDYEFISMNKIVSGVPLEYIGPDIRSVEDTDYQLIDPETGSRLDWVCHGHPCVLRTSKPVNERFIVRVRDTESGNRGEAALTADRTPKGMRQ